MYDRRARWPKCPPAVEPRVRRVLAIWTGAVPSVGRERVALELLSGSTLPLYTRINRSEVETYAKRDGGYQAIGLGHRASSEFTGERYYVIPLDELTVRARYELQPDVTTFVDCTTAGSPFECQEDLLTLAKGLKFGRLYAVDLQRRPGGSTEAGK